MRSAVYGRFSAFGMRKLESLKCNLGKLHYVMAVVLMQYQRASDRRKNYTSIAPNITPQPPLKN